MTGFVRCACCNQLIPVTADDVGLTVTCPRTRKLIPVRAINLRSPLAPVRQPASTPSTPSHSTSASPSHSSPSPGAMPTRSTKAANLKMLSVVLIVILGLCGMAFGLMKSFQSNPSNIVQDHHAAGEPPKQQPINPRSDVPPTITPPAPPPSPPAPPPPVRPAPAPVAEPAPPKVARVDPLPVPPPPKAGRADPAPDPAPPVAPKVDTAPEPRPAAVVRLNELVRAAKSLDAAERSKAAAALGEYLTTPDLGHRRAASKALSELGADSAPAAMALEKAGRDDDEEVRKFARQALIRLLAVNLKAKESAKRIAALGQIGDYKGEANIVGEALIEAMLDKTPAVQVAAAEALEKVNPTIQKHVFTILFGMNKYGAVRELGKLGTDASICLPLLYQMIANLKQEGVYADKYHLDMLFESVMNIGIHDKRFSNLIINTIKNSNMDIRLIGLKYFDRAEIEMADRVKILMGLISERGYELYAVNKLATYGAEAEAALPTLKKMKLSTDDTIRQAAQKAVDEIEKPKE